MVESAFNLLGQLHVDVVDTDKVSEDEVNDRFEGVLSSAKGSHFEDLFRKGEDRGEVIVGGDDFFSTEPFHILFELVKRDIGQLVSAAKCR